MSRPNQRRCSLPDCDRPHEARGYCGAHYRRWRKYGDPLGRSPYNAPPPPGMARCRNCGPLPVEEFYEDKNRRGARRSSECRACFRKRADTLPIKPRDYRSNNLRKFGITVSDYEAMADAQDNLCAICGQPERDIHHATGKVQRLAVDHDKQTGTIRGLLCARCNKGIGLLDHDRRLLLAAIRYLRATA